MRGISQQDEYAGFAAGRIQLGDDFIATLIPQRPGAPVVYVVDPQQSIQVN
jgi:hypothetical protein